MDEYISQLSWSRWCSFQFFLGDGDGLEAVQLLEQAAPLRGVQAVDEVARALRRVQRLHGLLLGVGAQPPEAAGGAPRERERQQPPPAAAPGRRARCGGGGRARPQAARRPAPQQRQKPGHGGPGRGDPRGSLGGRFLERRRLEGAGLSRPHPDVLPTGSRGAGHHALSGPTPLSPRLASPFPKARRGSGLSDDKNFEAVRPGELPERAGERCGREGASRLRRSGAGGRAGSARVCVCQSALPKG